MLEIRDARGRIREDLSEEALSLGIRNADRDLVIGSLNEMVLRRTDGAGAELIFHRAKDGRYMITHVDADGLGRTAVADGDPEETVKIGIGGEFEDWPGDHFIEPYLAVAVAERFMLDGGLDPTVEWRPSTAHL
ncbi:MAG TPA: hypothetical protein VF574_09475 [Allosphingosinicella sp.]|jgi:hypothetical protein